MFDFLSEETLAALATQFSALALPIAFIMPAIGGEPGTLLLGFLAGQGLLPLWATITGSFFGMAALDAFWFFVPRTKWGERFKNRMRVSEKYQKLEERLESISGHNDILVLFLSKVMVGTRLLTLAYLSIRNISFKKFLLYNGIANFVWALCLGYLGWFAGLGYYSLAVVSNDVLTALAFVGLAIAVFYGLLWYIRKLLIKG